MLIVAGGDIVLRDRLVERGALIVVGAHIAAVLERPAATAAQAQVIDAGGGLVLPGFIDVHVHGVEGHDTLDEDGDAVTAMATRLPRYGVTGFCPTTVACAPDALRLFLQRVRAARGRTLSGARVLPAHLESNFINADFRGAQPLECVRAPGAAAPAGGEFTGGDVLAVMAEFTPDVGIVTVAPEIADGLDLIRQLALRGHRVSLGHSGADFEMANAAFDAGARHATHLFNRMPPLLHRAPGLAGAVLSRDDVAAELICDGFHVHPALGRIAVAAKGASRIMAITDGTAGSGLTVGSVTRLGGRPIHVREQAAMLPDGTLAGSTLTMDRAFATIVRGFGCSVVAAAQMCATTPARQLGLADRGDIREAAAADLVVLDRGLQVTHTIVGGKVVFSR